MDPAAVRGVRVNGGEQRRVDQTAIERLRRVCDSKRRVGASPIEYVKI